MGAKAKKPTGKDLISELKEIRQQAAIGGGEKRIKAQHDKGKMTARERVLTLLDEGSFQEVDALMAHRHQEFGLDEKRFPGDSVVVGFGKVDGRMVAVFSQDFTVMGGSFSEVQGQKVAKILDLALDAGVPVIGLMDSVGARIQEGVYSLAAYSELFWRNTQASGVIPQISVMLGPCAGGSVYSPGLTDFVIMTRGTSHMFITGPKVIKSVTHEEVDFESLGGAGVHSTKSGVAHFAADSEEDAFKLTRQLLSYLPGNNAEPPPYISPKDDPYRKDQALNDMVPTDTDEAYDMRQVIERIVDKGSFFPVHLDFAPNALVGFARLHGQAVGIVANQPKLWQGFWILTPQTKLPVLSDFAMPITIPWSLLWILPVFCQE